MRRIVRAKQNQFRVLLFHSEMRNPRASQSAAAHKTVVRCARPTRFDGQTSHSLTKTNKRTDQIGISECETIWMLIFDRDSGVAAVDFGGDFACSIKQPFDAGGANGIGRATAAVLAADAIA